MKIAYQNTKEIVGTDTTDTNGCSVYTLAATCDMDYMSAMRTAEELFFRAKGKGARNSMIQDALNSKLKTGKLINGNKVTEIIDMMPQWRAGSGRIKLSYFAKTHKEGKYYCMINGHAVAIVNGVIIDNMPEGFSLNKIVFFAAKLEQVVEAE